ncbi:hypothetical protein HZS_6799 [Henneguya salminicola]|nr:hypothetical protein HZS_6799 [Henneguya salminicola]
MIEMLKIRGSVTKLIKMQEKNKIILPLEHKKSTDLPDKKNKTHIKKKRSLSTEPFCSKEITTHAQNVPVIKLSCKRVKKPPSQLKHTSTNDINCINKCYNIDPISDESKIEQDQISELKVPSDSPKPSEFADKIESSIEQKLPFPLTDIQPKDRTPRVAEYIE